MRHHNDTVFAKAFYLQHVEGDQLFPVRMRNRDTGHLAFRVSPQLCEATR